jgi:hypothetical protein
MSIVYKYILANDINEIFVPKGSRVISVQAQKDNVCLWILLPLDPELDLVKRTFRIFGTGVDIPDDARHEPIGTVQIDWMVWHVFEVLELLEND